MAEKPEGAKPAKGEADVVSPEKTGSAGSPKVVFEPTKAGPWGVDNVVATHRRSVWSIEPSEDPTPYSDVTINLIVEDPDEVDALIGKERVQVPADGKVSVELTTRGYVQVTVQDRDPTWVFVEESGEYDVTVPAQEEDEE